MTLMGLLARRATMTPVMARAPPMTAMGAGCSPSHTHDRARATTGTRYSAEVLQAMDDWDRATDHATYPNADETVPRAMTATNDEAVQFVLR